MAGARDAPGVVTIRVLLADDEELVREGFAAILGAQPDIDVVAEAATGSEAVERALETGPDVVLMDIRMPNLDGIEATRRVTDAGRARVLILTTFGADEYVYRAFRAGASGFLLKSVPRAQLLAGVRAIAAGDALLAPAITRRLIEAFVRRPPPSQGRPAQLAELTDRELEVLRLIARGLSNAEIARTLYLTDATVKTHVAHVLGKLRVRDRVQAVVAAYESGLVEPGVDSVTRQS
jgi:DNA-binding NarL/FixJ family response regulator